MNKPLFSIVCIMKNEAKTLQKCADSLKEFLGRGGEWIIADTGSTDDSIKIATNLGAKVIKAGEKFITIIDKNLAQKINKKFIIGGEEPIMKGGDRLFDFASARNFITSLAANNLVCTLDLDEAYTTFNIDVIEQYIKEGYEQFEYNFVFAHDEWGRPAIEFTQSKFFDKRKVRWEGVVHEVLQGSAKIKYLDKSIIQLEHWQLPGAESRSKYIVGLAYDCYQNPSKDRQSHYLGREFAWTGRPQSAIKELKRHVEMNRWPAEKAQSMIFIGDAYGMLNQPEEQIEWYSKAYMTDSTRREALIKMARFYQRNDNKLAAIAYATAALEIPYTPYYANDMRQYGAEPHEILYWAKGWIGDIKGAQEHLMKAIKYEPYNQKILFDTRYYYEYKDSGIDGWMTLEEVQFLYSLAKKVPSICEVGSWKGRSTHAPLSGCKGSVTAVDTWEGSQDPNDWTHDLAKKIDVFDEFKKNVGHFQHLKTIRGKSAEVAKTIPDKSYDVVFIDAGHTYEEVKEDIRAWKSKAKIALCGHDYFDTVWMGVCRAVDEELGGPDEVHETIWVKWLQKPKVSIVIPTLCRPEKLHRLLLKIKENAGYDNYEVLVGTDEFPPNNKGVPTMLKELVEKSTGELVMYLGNDCIPEKDFLQLAVFRMIREFPELDGLIGLNDGYWNGEFATHFLASKKLLPYLDEEFFHTGYYHTGCDNELTERCRKIGKYIYAEEAKVFHDHPVQTGFRSQDLDEVYKIAYRFDRMEHDKNLLHERSEKLGFELRENFIDPKTIPEICKFTDMIRDGKNFSFIKLGDGEINCMNGKEGKNCDHHPYSKELADALKESYTYLTNLPDTYIPTWIEPIEKESPIKVKGNVTGNIFLHDSISQGKYQFYETIKNSKRKKIFIGPKKLAEVEEFLAIDRMVEIPEVNCFSYNFKLEPEDNAIYLFSAGMPTKVWIAQLLKKNKNITCIDLGSALDPILCGINRTHQLPREELRKFYKKLLSIPKRIFTIWLGDEPSDLVKKCIKTHEIKGYEHRMITLDNCYHNEYIDAAIKAKQWGKACDYLRIHYLIEEGGIYLDADVEMFPEKNFDHLLNNTVFAAREWNGFINTAVIGAQKGNPSLIQHLQKVVKKFKGDDGLYFESSIEIFTPMIEKTDACILSEDYFYPYNHETQETKKTENTICVHHYLKSWK